MLVWLAAVSATAAAVVAAAGGLGGAMYVASQSITVATLGVALFTVCIVAGQTGNSLLVDRLGLGPRRRRTRSRPRASGRRRSPSLAVGIGVSDRWNLGDFKAAVRAARGRRRRGRRVPAGVQRPGRAGRPRARRCRAWSTSSSDSSPCSSILGVDHLASGEALPSVPSPLSGDGGSTSAGRWASRTRSASRSSCARSACSCSGCARSPVSSIGALLLDVVAPAHGGEVTGSSSSRSSSLWWPSLLAGLSGRRAATQAPA